MTPNEIQRAALELAEAAIKEFRAGGHYDGLLREEYPDPEERNAVDQAMGDIVTQLDAQYGALLAEADRRPSR